MKDGKLAIGYMSRSARRSFITYYMNQSITIADAFGAHYEEAYRYGGYTTSTDTPLINLYRESSGKELNHVYIHGGTGAGTIIDGMSGMDTIAIGPNTYDYHRPGERLDFDSFDRVYGYLTTRPARL